MYKQAVMFAGALLEMLAGMRHKRIILTAVILLLTSATALGIYRHYRVDAKRKHGKNCWPRRTTRNSRRRSATSSAESCATRCSSSPRTSAAT